MTLTCMTPFDVWSQTEPSGEDDPGIEPGDECGRWQHVIDESGPYSWKCSGTMLQECGEVICDTCGEMT